MPNCQEVTSFSVSVLVMQSAPPPAPPTPPKATLPVNIQVVQMPPNTTYVPIGVPTPIHVRSNLAIPDAAADVLPISVTETWIVTDVLVTLKNMRHDTAGDLRLSLRSPSYTDPVYMLNNDCGFANFVSMDEPVTPTSAGGDFIFTDDAAAPLGAMCGYPIAPGLYKPAVGGALRLLSGASAAGLWSFTFDDGASGGIGYFDEMHLTLIGTAGEVATYVVPETTRVTVLSTLGTLAADVSGGFSSVPTMPLGNLVVAGGVNGGLVYWYTSTANARVGATDQFTYRALVAGRETNWTMQQLIVLVGAPPPMPPVQQPVQLAPPAPFRRFRLRLRRVVRRRLRHPPRRLCPLALLALASSRSSLTPPRLPLPCGPPSLPRSACRR